MNRLVIAGGCVAVTAAIAIALATGLAGRSGTYGLTPASATAITAQGSIGSLLTRETAVLTRKGLSQTHASRAIDIQSQIAKANLVSKLEAAMGAAFAGVWFNPTAAQLHVGVTSPASERAVSSILARAGLSSAVVETPARFTWAQLQAAQQQWIPRLASLFAHAEVQTALNAQLNSVSITLSSAVPRRERAALQHLAARDDASVRVVRGPLGVTRDGMSTECSGFKSGAAYCNKTLTSGVTIESFTNKELCTAGPMAIPKTNKSATYLLTAGHCIKKGGGLGGKWYAYTRGGTKQEIGVAAEYYDETKADVGAILINNPGFWVNTSKDRVNTSKDPVFADTAEWTKEPALSHLVEGERQPVKGKTNCHEGQTTGQSCGEIGEVGITANVGGELVEGLVEDIGAMRESGDSGGPWLFIQTKAPYPVLMEGTHEGFNGAKLYYEPMSSIFKALTKLNLELLTTANETRP